MRFPYLCASFLLARQAASQLFTSSSGIPACAATCANETFTKIGCPSTGTTTAQWNCICVPGDGYFVNAVPCFNANCTPSDLQATSNWFTGECSFVGIVPPSFTALLDGDLPPPPPPGGLPPPPPGAPPPPGFGPPPEASTVIATTTVFTVSSPAASTQTLVSSNSPISIVASLSANPSSSAASVSATAAASTNQKQSSNSLSTGAIGGIAVCGVLGAGAAVFGMFLFIRRRRRISRSRGNIHIGEEDIKMLPQKHLSLRYPNTDGRDYSANLGTDERDPPPSPFQPKFAPALISISRA